MPSSIHERVPFSFHIAWNEIVHIDWTYERTHETNNLINV